MAKHAVFLGGLALLFLTGCPVEGTRSADKKSPKPIAGNSPKDVLVRWTANRESTVNTTGGGYQVHYSRTNNFAIPSTTFVTVPYVSGVAAPTQTTLSQLAPGTYYLRVVPFSAQTATGNASAQLTVVVR
jgi:subtilase family serine protease